MSEILTYIGRPVTELSREELIEALNVAYGEIETERRFHKMTLDILRPPTEKDRKSA
jgi:hypothetical protein